MKVSRVYLAVGALGIAVAGFAVTKYLTRNVKRVRGGVIRVQKFDTPPSVEPLNE